MKLIRNIIAILAGYAIFVISTVLLFQLAKIDPHADPTTGVMLLIISYGIVFAFLGGFLTQLMAKTNKLSVNYILAAILAGFATFSLLKSHGNHYSQLAAIFLFAPASFFGGLLCRWRRKD